MSSVRDIKCANCTEYRNEWCKKIIDSPDPDRLRDCQFYHEKGHWIRPYYNRPKQYGRICSICKQMAWYCDKGDYSYCPNCGTPMMQEGAQE